MAAIGKVDLSYAGEDFSVPEALVENYDVFCKVLSQNTWRNVLSKEDREHLQKFLPTFPKSCDQEAEVQETLSRFFSQKGFHFGSPLQLAWRQLNTGEFLKDMVQMKEEQRRQQRRLNQQERRNSFLKVFEVLFNRHQSLLRDSVASDEVEGLTASGQKEDKGMVEENAARKFRELMSRVHEEHREAADSSDDELQFISKPQASVGPEGCSKSWYHRLLRQHNRKQRNGNAELDVTKGITLDDIVRRDQAIKDGWDWDDEVTLPSRQRRRVATHPHRPPPADNGAEEQMDSSLDESDLVPTGQKERMFPSLNIRDYRKFVGVKADTPVELKEDLPEGDLYMSFFSLIRCIFLSIKGYKGELSKIEKKVGQWQRSSEISQCQWAKLQPSWIPLVQSALSYLAAEVGAVSSTDPLPGFMPVIEFRDRVDHWRWIGLGRDSDVELYVMFKHWMDTLEDAQTVIDYSDYLPPVVGGEKDIPLLPLSHDQLEQFHQLEQQRYMSPHKAFRLNLHGYEAVVGPLKGVPKQGIAMSKAREHFLLKSERPSVVTILSLARDAASRLPNGEGTRADICNLVRESQYVREVTDAQINAAVSGALDRLHYEKDPCVRYDSSRKLWIYLHRARAEEDFEPTVQEVGRLNGLGGGDVLGWELSALQERIHQIVELGNQNRKKLMAKPVRMRIILPSGKEVDLDTATEDHTGIAIELQPRSAPVIKTSEPKVARSKAVGGDRRTRRKAKTKNSPSPQKSRLTKQQTSLGMPRSHALSSTFCNTPDFVTPSNSNMATPDSQKQYSALLSVSSSASSEEEDFPLITSSVPQVPPPQMLMEDMMDGRSHLEALEQIFASDSESEVDEGEEEGGSTVKPAATGAAVSGGAPILPELSEGSDSSSSDAEMHAE